MTNAQLADWLDQLDSHTMYDAQMLTELPADLMAVVPTFTTAQMRKQIEQRGLGGSITTEDKILFTGYQASDAIARERCGYDACHAAYGWISGRGSIHRAAIKLLRETK
jgi:hypothetical protein